MTLADQLIALFPEPGAHIERVIDEALVAELLPDKPLRVRHIMGVVALGRELSKRLGADKMIAGDIDQVTLAHDIGYAESLRRTGFHPLDGAIFLAHRGAPEEIIHAVLHHSGAREGAKELPAIADYYAMLPEYRPTFLSDAVTWCDVQTGPDGRRLTIAERVQDVVDRYGPENSTSQAMLRSAPEFEDIYRRINTLFDNQAATFPAHSGASRVILPGNKNPG